MYESIPMVNDVRYMYFAGVAYKKIDGRLRFLVVKYLDQTQRPAFICHTTKHAHMRLRSQPCQSNNVQSDVGNVLASVANMED